QIVDVATEQCRIEISLARRLPLMMPHCRIYARHIGKHRTNRLRVQTLHMVALEKRLNDEFPVAGQIISTLAIQMHFVQTKCFEIGGELIGLRKCVDRVLRYRSEERRGGEVEGW